MQGVLKLKLMIGLVALSACTDTDSATNLNPLGPPMLRQVRMNHRVFDANGNSSTRRVFGFGAHELAVVDELKSGLVTDGIVVNNNFRLVIDELLIGNNLEEIACRAPIDEDAFSPVPIGATPDDIARCAGADDTLPSLCGGPTAVCICNIPGGCTSLTGALIEVGSPVGVLDVNQDGATDDTRFKAGAVQFNCTGASGQPIDVPTNLDNSYWQPSGDQNKPAMGGFEALGPAIVLAGGGVDSSGRDHGATIPTNSTCTIGFDASVVDKQGIQMCAPPDGDVSIDCNPGDMSAFSWNTEKLEYIPITFANNGMGVPRTGIVIAATAPLLGSTATTANNITMTECLDPCTDPVADATPFTAFAPNLNMPQVLRLDTNTCSVTTTTFCNANTDCPATEQCNVLGLAANAVYTITITTNVTDTYDQPAPAAKLFTFTTGMN